MTVGGEGEGVDEVRHGMGVAAEAAAESAMQRHSTGLRPCRI
jgi:hypothetical protein